MNFPYFCKTFGGTIVFSCLMVVLSQFGAAQTDSTKLSAEGQLRKAAHEFLFGDFANDCELKFTGKDKEILSEIVVSTERIEVDGKLEIALPRGCEQIASMFRHFVMRGENLDRIGSLTLLPYGKDGSMHHSVHTPTMYRVQVGSLPVPKPGQPRLKIVADCNGKAVITQIAFSSQNKLKVKFDDIPFRNLGEEHPVEKVDVAIDLNTEHSVAGHVELEREKFFTYYARPGGVHPSQEKWAQERNFSPGRQITKLEYLLVRGYNPNQPKLQERSDKPGHADLTFFQKYDSRPSIVNAIKPYQKIKYASCLDNYPDFMSVEHVGRGTPLEKYFDAGAELAGALVADQIADGGRTADYWEVKNESTIKSEWAYHWDKNAWDLLAEFHNKVADQIHSKAPQVKVGGPTSAWMQLQVNDFGLYRSQLKFMDLTRGKLDFYSHHFYEDFNTIGIWERRASSYSNYLSGRMESLIDMLQAHMHNTDNVRPILITECGSLQPGNGPSDYWLRIRSYSAYTHKLLRRPHQIDLSVPFAFLSVHWNPNSGDAAFIPNEGEPANVDISKLNPTPVTHFFNLWRDFNGRRLVVNHDRRWLDATAVYDDNKVYVALTNMGGQRLEVNLSGLNGAEKPTSISQRRCFYSDGEVVYRDDEKLSDLSAIPVDVEETSIVVIELPSNVKVSDVLKSSFGYAGKAAVKIDQPQILEIKAPVAPEKIESAQLIVGVFREGGMEKPIQLKVNGQTFQIDAEFGKGINHLFEQTKIDMPVRILKSRNKVEFEAQEGTVITSVHMECLSRSKP
jgi:agarase